MNSNLAEVGKPTRWPPGKSGNPAGKPPGTRTAFSQGFIRDFALVWAEEGLEAVRKVAKKSPEAFVAIAALRASLYIIDYLRDSTLSVERVANATGISPGHLHDLPQNDWRNGPRLYPG